ncbi:hypothetical protein SLEP1_g30139 [Rubroshorea leprosula]|uniref:Uncharacterized protein n=1 Tax=Rubroshorea leprosula TaxID=152421 RepID=A0AAV5K8L7_9ROSI|nr:hypothetical protein SLEP1_g30139 [Rubroshorea leprosula]
MGEEAASSSSNRPSIGFPLGVALLLIFLLCMSTLLSCWLKWHELRRLLWSSGEEDDDGSTVQIDIATLPVATTVGPYPVEKPVVDVTEDEGRNRPVLMPGDRVPKFIAIACPYERAADGGKVYRKSTETVNFFGRGTVHIVMDHESILP